MTSLKEDLRKQLKEATNAIEKAKKPAGPVSVKHNIVW